MQKQNKTPGTFKSVEFLYRYSHVNFSFQKIVGSVASSESLDFRITPFFSIPIRFGSGSGFGSGFGLDSDPDLVWIRIRIDKKRLDPDLDPDSNESGSTTLPEIGSKFSFDLI
jgi:hypothetical protein